MGLLRLMLRVDAAASGAMGLGTVVAASTLDGVLGVPAGWLVTLGVVLLAWAGGLAWLSTRERIAAGPAWTVVVLNLVWVVDSVVALLAGWFTFTDIGIALVIAQAVAVAAFAELQYVGLRRARA
jgi:hypothetical protein